MKTQNHKNQSGSLSTESLPHNSNVNSLASKTIGLLTSSIGIPIGDAVAIPQSRSGSLGSTDSPQPISGSGSGGGGFSFSIKSAISAMTHGKSDKSKHTPPVVHPHPNPPLPNPTPSPIQPSSSAPHLVENVVPLQSISLINQQQQQIVLKNVQGI